MKEKTKQILRYVACGLGGLALGIGLLGGLSMCASSGNKTTDSVNTILTADRLKHNAEITTAEGGYTGYTFSFDIDYNQDNLPVGSLVYYYRSISTTTYDFTSNKHYTTVSIGEGFDSLKTALNDAYEASRSTTSNDLRILLAHFHFKRGTGFEPRFGTYYSFVYPAAGSWLIHQRPFIRTNPSANESILRIDYPSISLEGGTSDSYLLTNGGQNPYYLLYPENTDPLENYTFQDCESYYKEQGYRTGHDAGYAEGYDDAYAEKDTGIAFTSCGVYPNAQVTLATDETIGNFKYMYLCHYITKPGYDEHTIYILWTTHATTGQYLGQVIDRNDSNSYSPAVTLGSFSEEATSSVTITATQDMEFGLWVGYITTFHNRGEITNSILWFGGGTSESDLQIYQNGYDEGYQNGNQAGQETGYEQGYERGQEVGDAEGYSRGYTEGFNQTNTKNVFSLFTSAFDSVASFFDLKIFGFLPLYWFFLAPLFIALISLLMRMVKH